MFHRMRFPPRLGGPIWKNLGTFIRYVALESIRMQPKLGVAQTSKRAGPVEKVDPGEVRFLSAIEYSIRDIRLRSSQGFMEPRVGIEPTTCCLRNSCSTTELPWRNRRRATGLAPRRITILHPPSPAPPPLGEHLKPPPLGETESGPEPGRHSPHSLVDTPESNPLGYGEGPIIQPRGATDPHGIEGRHAIGIDRIMWWGEDRHGISLHAIGIDRIMWSTDYPHSQTDWPHSMRTAAYELRHVPEDERRRIMCDNAAELYTLNGS